jgi:hypothetical protein
MPDNAPIMHRMGMPKEGWVFSGRFFPARSAPAHNKTIAPGTNLR